MLISVSFNLFISIIYHRKWKIWLNKICNFIVKCILIINLLKNRVQKIVENFFLNINVYGNNDNIWEWLEWNLKNEKEKKFEKNAEFTTGIIIQKLIARSINKRHCWWRLRKSTGKISVITEPPKNDVIKRIIPKRIPNNGRKMRCKNFIW